MLVEVIACTLADAEVARDAGADRVELCLAIEVGGLTPYLETIAGVSSLAPFPVSVMVRPQPGGFVGLNEPILKQIKRIVAFGLPNVQIVTGSLLASNELDLEGLRSIRAASPRLPLVCHRCFDLTPDPFVALEQLIDLGFDRVLTSGQAATALEGADTIAKLVEQAKGRIEILAGAGVRPHNARELIARTGVTQVHASSFADSPPPTTPIDYGPTLQVDREKVRALKEAAIGSLGFQPG